MAVRGKAQVGKTAPLDDALERVGAALVEARAAAAAASDEPGFAGLADAYGVSEEAAKAFFSTARVLIGDGAELSPAAARRDAIAAVASDVWEREIGPLLTTTQMMELLGVTVGTGGPKVVPFWDEQADRCAPARRPRRVS